MSCDKAPVGAVLDYRLRRHVGLRHRDVPSQSGAATSQDIGEFCREWGIDTSLRNGGRA